MKKSEIIKILTDFTRQSTNWCFDDSLMFTKEFLEKIEELGMLPPSYDNINNGFNDNYPIYQWETEDV
jgi:hypothetical protein